LRISTLVRAAASCVAALMLAAAPLPAPGASEQPVSLNFKDAEIDSVIGAFGHLLGRTFVIDPRVRGKITLETPSPVPRAQAYQLLQAVLRTQGFAVVETGALTRVVPEADAKLQAGPVASSRMPAATNEQVVTQIFRLNYESATNLIPVLRPLIAPNNTITAYPSNNSLVVTDYASNVQRIARIIASLDSPSTGEIEVVPVRHAVASDLAVSVARMLDDGLRPAAPGAAVDPGQRVQVMADPRMNAIMIRTTSAARLNLAKSLIARLDQPSETQGNIRVVYLRNAEAVRLVQVLRGVLAGEGGAGGLAGAAALQPQTAQQALLATTQPQPGQPGMQGGALGAQQTTPLQQTLPQPVTVTAGGAIIAADAATNSLIITAPEPVYRNLRAVIDKLDARRAQVFIESLIVEISAERAAELGIQWQFLSAPTPGNSAVIGGTNLPQPGTGRNILDVTANPLTAAQGINIGVVRGGALLGGAAGAINLGLLARALETDSSANILATPNLLTLDNEEARIIIGQNVPFITGQFTATGTVGAAVNPFQTIERRDVGTTLRVRPTVSEAGTVRMQIFQEVSSVQDRTLQAGLITNRRAIESNVLVDDGQVVVLGGLIEERVEGGESKVPGLGDVPVVGNLFRYDTRRRVKTNLLVFLRPVIVRDPDAAHGVTADRYDYIRSVQGDARLRPHWGLPEMQVPQLPPLPPPPGVRGPAGAPQSGISGSANAAALGAVLPGRAGASAGAAAPAGAATQPVLPPGIIQTAPNELVIPRRLEGLEPQTERAPAPDAAPQAQVRAARSPRPDPGFSHSP